MRPGLARVWPRSAASLRSVFIILLLLACFAVAPGLEAASCGGAQPCKCGDTVTSNYLLGGDLGPCSGHGLAVKSNVVLDCRGFQITGLGGTSERYGISLSGKPGAEISGATVKGCRVSRFHRGIRLRAASSSLIADNTASDNGDHHTHVGYGIDVSGGSHNNVLENNRVHGNADEGIHIGTGSYKNRFVGNTSADNYRENLYLLLANSNVFVRNTLGPGGVNSLYLKDSGGNLFEGNTFRGNTARIVGDARDNQFINNTFSGAGLHFQPYKGTARSPSNNRVTGGAITDARECVRFTSTRGKRRGGYGARVPHGGPKRIAVGALGQYADRRPIGRPHPRRGLDAQPWTTGDRSGQGCGRGARGGGEGTGPRRLRRRHVGGGDRCGGKYPSSGLPHRGAGGLPHRPTDSVHAHRHQGRVCDGDPGRLDYRGRKPDGFSPAWITGWLPGPRSPGTAAGVGTTVTVAPTASRRRTYSLTWSGSTWR